MKEIYVKVTMEDFLFNNMSNAKKEAAKELWPHVFEFLSDLYDKDREIFKKLLCDKKG